MNKVITLKPRISEKTYSLSETDNTYVFEVPKNANKHDIARSAALQFNVTVTSVRLTSIPGKAKRSARKGGRSVIKGVRNDVRKAFVTLAEGNKLPIFSAIEEPSNQKTEDK